MSQISSKAWLGWGVGLEFGVSIIVGAWGGYKLDQYLGLKFPFLMLAGIALGFFVGVKRLIWFGKEMNKP